MNFKNYIKFSRVVLVNLVLLTLGIVFAELVIKAKNNNLKLILNKYSIPNLVCNKKDIFDITHLYKSNLNLKSSYHRDENCYRSFGNKKNLKNILVIGGSTTDQAYVNEGETFQDILDYKFSGEYDFINAGVDGQSSYGHLYSLENWHKKFFQKDEIHKIIFYIGLNDTTIANSNSVNNLRYSLIMRIKDFLNSNSSLYVYLKSLKYNFQPFDLEKVAASHSGKYEFYESNIPKKIYRLNKKNNYQNGIKNMIKSYQDYFINANILIIQQQIPGCKFLNKFEFYERHSKESKLCSWLANVYLEMDDALDSLSIERKSRINVHKMYLENILEDEDVYDAVHTNKYGSSKIAEYISNFL